MATRPPGVHYTYSDEGTFFMPIRTWTLEEAKAFATKELRDTYPDIYGGTWEGEIHHKDCSYRTAPCPNANAGICYVGTFG